MQRGHLPICRLEDLSFTHFVSSQRAITTLSSSSSRAPFCQRTAFCHYRPHHPRCAAQHLTHAHWRGPRSQCIHVGCAKMTLFQVQSTETCDRDKKPSKPTFFPPTDHTGHSLSRSLIANFTEEEVPRVSGTANGKSSALQEKGKETSFLHVAIEQWESRGHLSCSNLQVFG